MGIDLIVISGDIANTAGVDSSIPLKNGGTANEYGQAIDFIQALINGINSIRINYNRSLLSCENNVVIVPGNHDVDWTCPPNVNRRFYNFSEFWFNITGKKDYLAQDANEIFIGKFIKCFNKNIFIAGFNSCTVTSEPHNLRDIGLVERRQLNLCKAHINNFGEEIHRKIAVVHHHPCYIPLLSECTEEYDALYQSGEFLTFLQENEFDLVLHGHKHYPVEFVQSMRPYEIGDVFKKWSEPVIISGGSLSVKDSSRYEGIPNTYNIIGLRLNNDAFSKKSLIVRRKFSRTGTHQHFSTDSIRYLGEDLQNPTALNDKICKSASLKDLQNINQSNVSRAEYYKQSDGWMIIHKVRKNEIGDDFSRIRISLMRHHNSPKKQKEIIRVIYDVGTMFQGSPFICDDGELDYELLISAYSPFLCAVTIVFSDGSSVSRERYIDF
jgi:hypothetical protein